MSDAPGTDPGRAVLYTRASCAPCFSMKRAALWASRRARVPLEVVDVDSAPELVARYGTLVPVLVLPGGGVLSGGAGAAEIERAFRAIAPARSRRLLEWLR